MKTTAVTKVALATISLLSLAMMLAACGNSAPSGAAPHGPTPPAGTPTGSTTPRTVDTAIEVYGDCTSPSLEPTDIILTCADDGWVLQDIAWSSWTSTVATGVATLVYNDCSPSCAEGHFHQVPDTQLVLTDPISDTDGQLVWSKLQETPWPPGYTAGPEQGAPFRLLAGDPG